MPWNCQVFLESQKMSKTMMKIIGAPDRWFKNTLCRDRFLKDLRGRNAPRTEMSLISIDSDIWFSPPYSLNTSTNKSISAILTSKTDTGRKNCFLLLCVVIK
jgi:hypothetical protein